MSTHNICFHGEIRKNMDTPLSGSMVHIDPCPHCLHTANGPFSYTVHYMFSF